MENPLNDGPATGETNRIWDAIVQAYVGSRHRASVRPFE
jgi:hypothetical protein